MASEPIKTNVLTDFPPAIAWVAITLALAAMVQFQSTEKLSAAFAWLIFVAVLLANGPQAFDNISTMITGAVPTPSTNAGGSGGGGTAKKP